MVCRWLELALASSCWIGSAPRGDEGLSPLGFGGGEVEQVGVVEHGRGDTRREGPHRRGTAGSGPC
jgi:hypothetical protein